MSVNSYGASSSPAGNRKSCRRSSLLTNNRKVGLAIAIKAGEELLGGLICSVLQQRCRNGKAQTAKSGLPRQLGA
jgi:hypothetical protein